VIRLRGFGRQETRRWRCGAIGEPAWRPGEAAEADRRRGSFGRWTPRRCGARCRSSSNMPRMFFAFAP